MKNVEYKFDFESRRSCRVCQSKPGVLNKCRRNFVNQQLLGINRGDVFIECPFTRKDRPCSVSPHLHGLMSYLLFVGSLSFVAENFFLESH